ncbi:hypothetical protein DS2_08535 [Catenovulum agarivorans DS-2]|uniref:Lysozyme inhibitor LprI-like N-terminal domain-containing protein n=1 Tax=Catenovulum agarivorans DS-2 TaxID=1328313 RepID=W7QMY3_9ALTE|nr:lysozyme inhibitor LprI family protein [Catenovulum agarivorans]EWH10307.1 hypothetical protein DS2_08535 [Catenovulum agarivorans DS-2]
MKSISSFNYATVLLMFCYLVPSSALAESAKNKAKRLIAECENSTANHTAYAICLDETEKQINRELNAWILDAEDKLRAQVNKSGNESMLSEFKRANAHYDKFIESQCRSVFFQNLSSSEAASKFRACKITKTLQRIEQLKEESE